MKPIAILAALSALFVADIAAAAAAGPAHPRRAAAASVHKASLGARHRARQHALRMTTPNGAPGESPRIYRATDSGQDLPSHPAWFTSEKAKEAGWGVNDHGTQTVVGLYQRPPRPDIPGPQTYHDPEGRGAAGLSLSFKLGN